MYLRLFNHNYDLIQVKISWQDKEEGRSCKLWVASAARASIKVEGQTTENSIETFGTGRAPGASPKWKVLLIQTLFIARPIHSQHVYTDTSGYTSKRRWIVTGIPRRVFRIISGSSIARCQSQV